MLLFKVGLKGNSYKVCPNGSRHGKVWMKTCLFVRVMEVRVGLRGGLEMYVIVSKDLNL